MLSGAGITSLADGQIWVPLLADLDDMLICSLSDLETMQLGQLYLATTDVTKGRLLIQLRRTVKARGRGGAPVLPGPPVAFRYHGRAL